MKRDASDGFVFFGATGDLAKKQIFPALQGLAKRGRLDMPVVAVGRKPITKEALLATIQESLRASGGVDALGFDVLSRNLSYVAVDFDDPRTFSKIREALGTSKQPLHYVALPPDMFAKVAENLSAAGLAKGARLVLEKPFGSDGKSAKALSKQLHAFFSEEALFRIDHYLGKETVENIVYFRAANPLVEATLHRDYIAHVQITMAEDFGVKGRAAFYDGVGALRDVVQNHLLEVVTCLTMALPVEPGHEALRAHRSELLANVKAMSPRTVVRGQVRGYENEEGVKKGSTTETFVAAQLELEVPRWKEVPFFLRAGKSLAKTATEVVVTWKSSERPVLDETSPHAANRLRFSLGKKSVVAMTVNLKSGGEALVGDPTEVELHTSEVAALQPYDRLLGDAMIGDQALFADKQAAEHAWRIVDPVLAAPPDVQHYEPGSWGPADADRIAPPGGWIEPS